jgi:hypothetical protein
MALSMARGLFRLWLVSTVLWIVAVGALTYFNVPQPPRFEDTVPAEPSRSGLSDHNLPGQPPRFGSSGSASLDASHHRGSGTAKTD